ncbi:hypothetical protein [Paenibacillus endoradicis]|uniref:hypothetical protein n=1 Tax=Paenibacillus endoradicis TaxID=2972487 RepID=UPI0021593972|nr:hypothetical protein [Paenibacillus endoradicis]MCR8656724.1 hypothetical protein [Paenibacillus endoradicis]
MSLPNIPNIDPNITLCTEDVFNMLMASIAMKGLGLSHLVNAEAEKVQFALGTLHASHDPACLDDILKINDSVRKTLTGVMQTELILLMQLSTTLENFCDAKQCDAENDSDCIE